MQHQVIVVYDEDEPNKVHVGGSEQPWNDMAILMEGLGVTMAASIQQGKLEHNGKPLNEYLKDYVDKVFADYRMESQAVN